MDPNRSVESRAPESQSCWQRNWPRAFLFMSIAVVVLSFVGIILSLAKIVLSPSVVLLDMYCLLFSLLGLSAELRQFSLLRRVVYVWMKFFYFLVYYRARGIFYIFFGILLLGNGVAEIMGGIVAIALGTVMLLVGVVVGLPEFEDPAEAKRVQEEFQRYYGGGSPSAAAGAPSAAAAAPASQAAKSGAQADPPAVSASANLYREYNFGDSPTREESRMFSNPGSGANSYEDRSSFQGLEANMFASDSASAIKLPMQEAGLTRGEGQSALN
ncbi:hypothetical protein GH5_07727 [Leishmania sp. Ghana 2012 LV757]|uniref:hypothetical protein n=1 Tax=Leishmania sp. Ghana 2012 LV757 TaxID=2803181 RepID=UPI001B65C5F7|nr:hypothetical protein GH5_07727 [Leishmania sp. Ghana 2012 LV757]